MLSLAICNVIDDVIVLCSYYNLNGIQKFLIKKQEPCTNSQDQPSRRDLGTRLLQRTIRLRIVYQLQCPLYHRYKYMYTYVAMNY